MKRAVKPFASMVFLMSAWGCSSESGGTTGTGGSAQGGGGSTSTATGGSNGSGGKTGNGTGGATASGSGGATTSGSGGANASGGGTGTAAGGSGDGGRNGGGPGGNTATTGGMSGAAGRSGSGGAGTGTGGATGAGGGGSTTKFSFFVTSLAAMKELSGNEMGFGGDLTFGETGDGAGLRGADKICSTIAEKAVPGAGTKGWHAFLSTVAGPVNAIDRIGDGPWYDRMGRLVSMNKTDLINVRPKGADPAIINDLPNENGTPNHTDGAAGCTTNCPDNHDVLTGTGVDGKLYATNVWNTCYDWTNKEAVAPSGTAGPGGAKGPWCGHSWPRSLSGENWMSSLAEGGCGPGVNLQDNSVPGNGNYTVGGGGGYGGIYCFATMP